jgi:hypothetical protein
VAERGQAKADAAYVRAVLHADVERLAYYMECRVMARASVNRLHAAIWLYDTAAAGGETLLL